MTIAEEAKALIDKQCKKGIDKYGKTLDSNNAKFIERIRHAQEEAADLLQYLVWMERKAQELDTLIALHQDVQGSFEEEDFYTNTDPITII